MRSTAVLTLLLAATLSPGTEAQQSGVRVGGATVYPVLGLGVGYDENVALQAGDERQESLFYLLSPGLRVESGSRRSSLRFELSAELGEYRATTQDDFVDYGASVGWIYEPTLRHTVGLSASHDRRHFRRGDGVQGFVRPDPDDRREVDRYRDRRLDVVYGFGADGARGHLELTAGLGDLRYENNRDITRVADFDRRRIGASFGWRIAPKTTLLALGRLEDTDFVTGSRDNVARFLGLGVEWEATAKTSGRIEAGHREAAYADSDADFSGSSWRASVEWRPRDYSLFEVATGRTTDTAFGTSTFLVRESYELTWRHQWRARWGTVVDVGWADEQLRPGSREDQVQTLGVAANYQFRRWLQLGASWRRLDRDSTEPLFDFDRPEFLLSAELAF